MKSADLIAHRQKIYCDLMEEVKKRTSFVISLVQGQVPIPLIIAYELGYLQLRLTTECIALSCLVAHGDIEKIHTRKFARTYQADKIINQLTKLHPEFYPRPTKQILDKETGRPIALEDIQDGYLTRRELVMLYNECGAVLHRGSYSNFFEKIPDNDLSRVEYWVRRIIKLLNHHSIQTTDPDYQFWVLMQANQDGRVHGFTMKKVDGQ